MKKYAVIFLFLSLCASASAQTGAQKTTKKNARSTVAAKSPVENADTSAPQKKNAREETTFSEQDRNGQKKNRKETTNEKAGEKPVKNESFDYFYEFTHPEFSVRRIVIEHDANGKGKVSFTKKNFDEPVTDPLQLSPVTLEKLKSLFAALNFLESNEEYQSAKYDYKHLGTAKIRFRENGRERIVEFNWTENKDAKALADEYRKIGNQYVWQFDMSVARENQPLEAPGLMDLLESYLKRNEISDPPQMIPLLEDLSNDERIPLMARNRAAKLIKQIQGKSKK
jgi:hypothetical protein